MGVVIALNIILVLCVFVMGSLFGSFFSLATYRIPRKQDIVATRSYCPNCKHRLEFFDLIPVFSYLFRGAKCKYCSDPISPRYFLLEVSNGILFVILYLIFGYNLKFALVVLVYAILFVCIGAYIMKQKMTEEEIQEVKKKQEEKKYKKLNNKSGVFVSELVIAIVLFVGSFLTIIMINQNTRNKMVLTLAEAQANTLLIKNLELCNMVKYDDLNSKNTSFSSNGVTYDVNLIVTDIYANDSLKKDIIKKIDITVGYNVKGKYYELKNSTLKGKE